MSTLNQAGDVLTQTLVKAICNEIIKLDLQKQNDLPNQMQEILAFVLQKPVSISPRYLQQQFPQLYTEDFRLYIRYHIQRESEKQSKWKSILLQLSVATVLACCPPNFVDEYITIDETFCTFSQKWPNYANMANQIYNLILTKAISE